MGRKNLIIFLCAGILSSLSLHLSAKNHDKFIVGHYSSWSNYGPSYQLDDVPIQRLTHLIYQNANVTPTGGIEPGDRYLDIQKLYLDIDITKVAYAGTFAKLAKFKKQYPELKTLISIGRWGYSYKFSEATTTEESRHRLASACVDFMLTYGFDGIDIFWQASDNEKTLTIDSFQIDRKQFVAFMTQLRGELNQRAPKAILTATLNAMSFFSEWETRNLEPQIDFINLSAAYLHGPWEKATDHLSPLYDVPNKPSVDQMLNFLVTGGIPEQKIVLDIVTFGQAWQGIANINHGLYQPANAISLGSWDTSNDFTGLYSRLHVQQIIAMPGYTEYWDDTTKTAYSFNPERYSGHFISYENERSIAAKIDYVNAKGLRGVGILEMHNDKPDQDSLLFYIHKRFYFLQSIKYSLNDFLKHNQEYFFTLIKTSIFLIFSLITAIIIYSRRKNKNIIYSKNLNAQKDNLLLLEWSLIQLLYLTSYFRRASIKPSISSINGFTVHLLKTTTTIISHSDIRYSTKSVAVDILDISIILANAKVIINETKKYTNIFLDSFDKIFVRSDYMLLTQIIYRLCFILSSNEVDNKVTIKGHRNSDGSLTLQFTARKTDELSQKTEYFLLKEAYVLASSLGLTLLYSSDQSSYISLHFPNSMVINSEPPALTLQSKNVAHEKNSSLPSNDQFSTHFSRFTALIEQDLENIDYRSDSGKFIERACESFLEMNNVLRVDIAQPDQKTTTIGNQLSDAAFISEVNNGDLTFILHSIRPLKKEDIVLFDVLISQIQLVRKALKGLTKDSKLLNELHFLSSNHDNILYIQADSGYSFVHVDGIKEPKLLSIRLRAIKYFFDDQTYLQVHRSCIVNPKKVDRVIQVHKLKFEIKLNSKKIPLSRVYVSNLKEKYPHWFLITQ